MLHCPSSQPDMPEAKIHAVLDAASGRMLSLEEPLAASPDILAATLPLLPTQVLRFSSPCQGASCGHFAESRCTLIDKLVMIVPSEERLPVCAIRRNCLWFRQQGGHACVRCHAIVTDSTTRSEEMIKAATPVSARA